MQEAEGNMRPELTDRSRSQPDGSPKTRRKKKQLEVEAKRKQIQGEKGNIAFMNNETESTLNKNAWRNTTAIADSGEKAKNHRQKEKLSFTESDKGP
jgi:hypothetical protein